MLMGEVQNIHDLIDIDLTAGVNSIQQSSTSSIFMLP